ncbi:MAG: penicillin-binding protein 1C [Prolixibacteraceae bacterium]
MSKLLFSISLSGFLFLIIWVAIPLEKPIISKDYSQTILASDGEILRVFLNKNDQWCMPPVASDAIPEKLKTSVILYEDEYFRYHPGVNPVSIFRAIVQNIKSKRIVSGASTINMQIARMKFNNRRTFISKLEELFYAIKLDVQFKKESILAIYLNHAPYGGNIIGYKTASMRYFQKQADKLSWAEAALLAVLPNSPSTISPSKNNDRLKQKRDGLLNKLFQKGRISESVYKLALTEPIPQRAYPFEMIATHLTQRIHNAKNSDIVETTINYTFQKYFEFICRQYANQMKQQGIKNLSAIVIDNKKKAVVSYIGSQNYFDTANNGMIDGVQAARSSGSILKPFLYALSIDEGLITPNTVIFDIPTYFDAFSPNNADEKFNGVVYAKDALSRSLNVPAVRLLNSFGLFQFYSFLKEAGITTLFRNADDYGLPLIIGGAETAPWEMAQLYCGLANNGNFSPIVSEKKDSLIIKNEENLISYGSTFLTLEMLKELKRPGAEFNWQRYRNNSNIAWKTGTSYGHKDAWAAGCTPEWTIVVWVGNFDGEGNVLLNGMESAGPLFFEIFNYLPKNPSSLWFEKKLSDFKTIQLCSETGFIAGPNCPHKQYTSVPKAMNAMKTCPYHMKYEVNTTETKTVCSLCWGKEHHSKSYLVYPPEVNYQLNLRGIHTELPPNHDSNCTGLHLVRNMDFIYPKDSSQIWLPRDFNGELQKVVFKLAHQKSSALVYWYLDDQYLGLTQTKHTKVLQLTSGWHQLMATDNFGEKCKTTFQIGLSKAN